MSKDGPFGRCAGQIPIDGYMRSCVLDVCSNANDSQIMKEQACNAMAVIARECKDHGVSMGKWNEPLKCRKLSIFTSCWDYK